MEQQQWKSIKEAYYRVIEAPDGDRAAILTELSPEIRKETERLIASTAVAGDFLNSPFLVEIGSVRNDEDEGYPGQQIDDYVLIENIGSGGMGNVFLAEHRGEGFSHKVAVKLIKRGMDTGAVLKRFLLERQILASLEHPFIARMLDGGATTSGLPYFVMEYVSGQPINLYCDSHLLNIRSRLELFLKICDAVAHAHKKLVVHRDLKPSNILIAENGDPKLLDFGIAKLLKPDWIEETTITAPQFRILTPEYASPEQLRGEPTTTSTDVYSLGVVLYELMTGVRPFGKKNSDPASWMDVVQTSEPRKPSAAVDHTRLGSILDTAEGAHRTDAGHRSETARPIYRLPEKEHRSLRGDLDNIVLKSIRKEPERRYDSVQEMADDIRRYLNGLPVKATADTFVYRLNKFVRRHHTAALLTTAAGILVLAGTGVTAWQYFEARKERARAEARFTEVRKLANSLLFEHYERIKDLPGATEAKAKIVADAVDYLDAISRESSNDQDLQRELVEGYRKLAEIMGTSLGGGDLGDRIAARDNFEKALAIQRRLVASNPENIQDQRTLARLLADSSYASDSPLEDRSSLVSESVSIFNSLRERNPDRVQAESDYARGLWDLANTLRIAGDIAQALQNYEEAVNIYESLYAGGVGDKRFRRSSALTYKNIGTVYRLIGDNASSLDRYEKALKYDLEILSEDPGNVSSRLAVSFSRNGIGDALMGSKQPERAVEEYSKALSIMEDIVKNDPKNDFAAGHLVETYGNAGAAYSEIGNYSSAANLFTKASDLDRRFTFESSDVYRRSVSASMHLKYGQMILRRSPIQRSAAISELQTAFQIFSELRNSKMLDPAYTDDENTAKRLLIETNPKGP